MKKAFLFLLLFALLLTGCAARSGEDEKPDEGMDTIAESGEAAENPAEQDLEAQEQDTTVMLFILEKPRGEYELEQAEALLIRDLFYNDEIYEKQVLSTPVDNKPSMKFRIGDDYLETYPGERDLVGRIRGERVLVRIGKEETEYISALFDKYTATQ